MDSCFCDRDRPRGVDPQQGRETRGSGFLPPTMKPAEDYGVGGLLWVWVQGDTPQGPRAASAGHVWSCALSHLISAVFISCLQKTHKESGVGRAGSQGGQFWHNGQIVRFCLKANKQTNKIFDSEGELVCVLFLYECVSVFYPKVQCIVYPLATKL